MDILKAFKLDKKEIQINIQGTDEDPLFQANQIGELLDMCNIRATIIDFDNDEKVVKPVDTLGGKQKTTFLTEQGLYRLLGRSQKPIARTFQKWVCQVVKEIRRNGKYELQAAVELEKTLAQNNIEKEKHDTLIQAFNNKRIIYFTKLQKHENDKYVIKLGFSNNIKERQRALVVSFGNSTFLNVFECNQNCEFELMLKRHRDFVKYRYREVVVQQKSSETYLLSMPEYEALITIVKRNVHNYQGFDAHQFVENKRLDIQKELIELVRTNPESKELQEALLHSVKRTDAKNLIADIVECEDTYELEKIGEGSNIPRLNTRNRKLQQYSIQADDKTFVLFKTYDGLMDALRNNEKYSKNGLKSAAENNTIYYDYRWFFIERNAENIAYTIPPTKPIQSSVIRHIAMLNRDNSVIEKVFVSLADAATAIDIKRKTTICDAIKKHTMVKNMYYFKYFQGCDEELKNAFLSKHQLPKLTLSRGTKINQKDINSKLVIKTYTSIANVLKHVVISREHLKRACETGEVANNFLWEYAE